MNKHQEVRRVAVYGMGGNIFLLIIKLIVGFSTSSHAMIADGLNSAGDVFSSLMTYIGNKIATKPGDHDHPYGHGKAEYIFSMIISFSLLLVSFAIFRSSYDSLVESSDYRYSPWLIVVALTTIAIKAGLFVYTSRVGHKYQSLLALANSEDHRNDVFLTILTLISVICGYFDIHLIDSIAGMLIAGWIAYTGIKIFTESYNVLMDKNMDEGIVAAMETRVVQIDGVDHIDAIQAKPVGLCFLLIAKVSIDAHLTIYEGHCIADQIKTALMEFDHIEDVVVHLNPTQFHPERSTL